MNYEKYSSDYRNLIVGVDTKVPLINGSMTNYINFDNAATTPPFHSVLKEIVNFAPWYSSIHRGTGYKSKISSDIYDKSRFEVANFVKADIKHNTIIYVKNTTEAINKLTFRLCNSKKKCVILSTDMEHHSNDLPWRNKYRIDYVGIDKSGRLVLEDLEEKLIKYRDRVQLVTVAGASNVTGYKNPIYKIARLAHKYNAKILVDGAQLVPHSPVDMKPDDSPEHIDFLVFSSHKMYAPFGIGVLIGPKSVFEYGDPDYMGGGTVKMVTHNYIGWDDPPNKEEAGTPNIMGVVALLASIRTLKSIGMDNIELHERDLTEYALSKMRELKGITIYGNNEDGKDRVGIISFNINDMPHDLVAKILSYEGGIAVRNGCFCAQPYIQKLLNMDSSQLKFHIDNPSAPRPGMVRISFGLYNTFREIDIFINLLSNIISHRNYYIKKYKNY